MEALKTREGDPRDEEKQRLKAKIGELSAEGAVALVKHFTTIEELRLALLDFKNRYNTAWIMESHGTKTPRQAFEAHQAASSAA